jgi:murein DD-endopeptidase MepM/ murein hydrolase activator NlpD
MMLRVLLSLALFVVGFGAGFYFGDRSTRSALRAVGPPAGERPSAFEERARVSNSKQPPQTQSSETPSSQAESAQLIEKPVKTSTLGLPIAKLKKNDIIDTYDDLRGSGRKHEATDVMAPIGTPVLAVTDGTIKKLFNSQPGGLTIYLFDTAEKHCYYYAHLLRYADGLQEGQTVKRGDVIGYVGATGNASPEAPHLHFAVFELGPEKEWWRGTPINPHPLLLEAWESSHQ